MEPEQHQYPIDYLDEISTAPKKSGFAANDKLFFIIIIGGLLMALVVGVLAFLSTQTGSNDNLIRLNVRVQNIKAVADSSQRTITSSNLRGINTGLSLALTNADRDIQRHIAINEIDMSSASPNILSSESLSKLNTSLEDARLNGVFDRTYAREMSYQLSALGALLEQIETNAKAQELRQSSADIREQITPIQKQFSEFSGATSSS